MPNFSEAGAHAKDPEFIQQVTVALIMAAGTVATEDRSQYPDSRMFNQRRSLAVNVLMDPETWAKRFAWIVQYDPRVRASAPSEAVPNPAPVKDSLLAGIIYWMWNAVSGAGPATIEPPTEPVQQDARQVAASAVLVPHPVSGVRRVMGAPLGDPLHLRTEGDEEQIQMRHPIRPPGAPADWPGVSPWDESLQRGVPVE